MNLKYWRLNAGYHYVCDADFDYLFAQWPIGETCKAENVSGIPETYSCVDFCRAAQALADLSVLAQREQHG